jgi:hypothetical protein
LLHSGQIQIEIVSFGCQALISHPSKYASFIERKDIFFSHSEHLTLIIDVVSVILDRFHSYQHNANTEESLEVQPRKDILS